MELKYWKTNWERNDFWKAGTDSINSVDCMRQINVHPDFTYQTVEGFGGAFTEAAAYTYSLLSEEAKAEFMEAYFGREGLGYTLGRTHMNSCDFALGNYACMEDPLDRQMNSFTIEREQNYIIPMILKAQEVCAGPIQMLISPWSPPGFMKTNGQMNFGGKLKEEYYELWADYYVRFIKEYRKAGIFPSMVSVQNEPDSVQTWDSCVYSGEEERDFVKNYLGPALKKSGLCDLKLLIWDHNKESVYTRTRVVMEDADAGNYVDGVAFHWYTGDHFEEVALVREAYPQKLLYFTEGCVEYSRFADSDEMKKAQMYAHDLIGNFNAGMNAYIDWNLLLDAQGGPNHVHNFCAAPIMSNEKKDAIVKNLSYFYIGHFSRFVKKGAKRMAVSRYTDQVEVTGFVNPDQERVIILLNKSEEDIPFSIYEYGEGNTLTIEAHSMMTITYKIKGEK